MDQAAGISTNVNEVSLDLVVHDKKHNAILDLKPDDLTVTDDGVPVKLTGFRLVDRETAASRGHLITLLFDHIQGPTAKSTRIIAQKILSVLPSAGYSFSVLQFQDRLRLIQDFTEDRQAVTQAVNVVTESHPIVATSSITLSVNIINDHTAEEARSKSAAEAEKNLIAVTQTGVDAAGRHVDAKERARAQTLATALRDSQSILQEQRGKLQLAGLLALVKSQQGIGDRKALIYFTLNRQLDPASKKLLATISDAAARAGVTIYTIDMDAVGNAATSDNANANLNAKAPVSIPQQASGIPPELIPQGPPPGAGPGYTPQNGGFGSGGYTWSAQDDIRVMTDFMRNGPEDLTNPFADTKSPMAAFSKATGGAYIDGQGSTKKPLEQMAQDLDTYYQASYVPPITEYDGKFRTIAVKTLRVGLNIQTKTGYFALAADADAGIQPFEGPLLKSFSERELPTALKFHAAVLRFGDLPDGNANSLVVEVPLSELETKPDPGLRLSSAHVSIVAQVKDESGIVVEHASQDITRRGAKETLAHDPLATVSLNRHFTTVPGKYTLEVAVLDQNSGKAGARRSQFEIPEQPGKISLSDMVLVRGMTGSNEDHDDPQEPLRYQHQKVSPNVTGELPSDAHDASMFFILHPDPASSEPMTLEMEMIRNGKSGTRKPLLHVDGVQAPMAYLASIKSRGLLPGDYEVKAYLTQGSQTAEQSNSFHVGASQGTETDASKGFDDLEIGSDEGNQPVAAPARPAGELAIVASAAAVPPTPPDQARLLIDAARERALSYNDLLPNFMCTEMTRRSVDFNGDGKWRQKDTLLEALSFRDRQETRTTLEINGNPSDTDRYKLKGTFSAGEFGGVLQAVFRNESKTDFRWKETDTLKGGPGRAERDQGQSETVEVFDYRVDPANSSFSVTGSNGKRLVVGYRGQVFVETASRRVRRVTLIADNLPADFPTHSTAMAVDYDYVAINGLKYLMPITAELRLSQGRSQALMNTMEFRDYKRFAADLKTAGVTPGDHP
ncbi:MAG: VWA domain-containing protein [Terracidiphilus sp.]